MAPDDRPDDGLDAIDRRLLTLLQEDGRLPYSDLAADTGLSSGAARARVLRLQERGILRIVGVTDPLELGYRSMAMLAVSVEGDVDAVADALGALDAVIYLVVAAGSADLLVEVIAPDTDALYDVVNRQIRTVPGVRGIETYSYYRTHTHRFTWGTR
ncbi:Lrp/AsnC family transcriptional regulator [Patulibacter americanus]|jgi:Lrp/AsnC family transcriptional regulator for asnA, asnC and gidA|uniref:Lrp/AsnC family transcriptional regulator n=1 Tax=Patulibacter americanus TaxID=588672 RepID=UPI0003B4E0E4|nr:Lrp/AsnC family transcriptional regulator [Patulibacter americanus]